MEKKTVQQNSANSLRSFVVLPSGSSTSRESSEKGDVIQAKVIDLDEEEEDGDLVDEATSNKQITKRKKMMTKSEMYDSGEDMDDEERQNDEEAQRIILDPQFSQKWGIQIMKDDDIAASEKRKYSTEYERWTNDMVSVLLEEIEKHKDKILVRSSKKKVIFAEIAKAFQGIPGMTPECLVRKWSNILTTYKRIRQRSRMTGVATHRVSSWEFYDTVRNIVGNREIGKPHPNESYIKAYDAEMFDDAEPVPEFKWNHRCSLQLLDEIRCRSSHINNPLTKNRRMFAEIARNFTEFPNVDAYFLQKKWSNFLITYKRINRRKKSGNVKVTWEYYDIVDEIVQAVNGFPPGEDSDFSPPSPDAMSSDEEWLDDEVDSPKKIRLNMGGGRGTKRKQEEEATDWDNQPPPWFQVYMEEQREWRQLSRAWEEEKISRIEKMHKEKLEKVNELLQLLK